MAFNYERDKIAEEIQAQQAANARLRGKKAMAELGVATAGLEGNERDKVISHLIHARTGGLPADKIRHMILGMETEKSTG